MPSFSQLLKNSRLSKFDPALSQVYKTYGEYHRRGEYGVKRNLPNHLRTNVVTIGSIDTIEHQTPYKSAETLTRFTRKCKENFLISKRVEPLKLTDLNQRDLKNVAKMSNKEFKKLLKKIEKRKDEWNQLSTHNPESWLEFLGLTYDTRNSTLTVRGLTYSHNDPGVNFQIQGRILNRDSNGVFAVGISGLIGSLHFGKAQRLAQVNRKKLDNFYVEKVEFDDQGRPNIRVSHTPLLSSSNYLNILDHLPGKTSFFFDSATDRVKEDEKIQGEILSRLRSLLKTNDSSSSNKAKPSTKPGFQMVYEEMFSKVNSKENENKDDDPFQILQEHNKAENDESSMTNIESSRRTEFQIADELFKDLIDDEESN